MAPNTGTDLITMGVVSTLITVTTEVTVVAITGAMAGGHTAMADGPVEAGEAEAEATTAALVAADKPWKTKSESETCRKQLRHPC